MKYLAITILINFGDQFSKEFIFVICFKTSSHHFAEFIYSYLSIPVLFKHKMPVIGYTKSNCSNAALICLSPIREFKLVLAMMNSNVNNVIYIYIYMYTCIINESIVININIIHYSIYFNYGHLLVFKYDSITINKLISR